MIGAGSFRLGRAGQMLFVAFLVAIVALAGTPSPIAQGLAVGGAIIAFAHGLRVYGCSGIVVFLAFSLAATFAIENLSIITGFPFGHYHFEVAAALPHVGAVPIIVGLLYFGVPLSNYVGWYLTVWLFYQAFALFVYFRPSSVRPRPHGSWLPPILVYLAVALSYAVPYLIGHDGEVVDVTGHGWRAQDLRETTMVVMLFTMLFTSALALLRWAARRAGAAT